MEQLKRFQGSTFDITARRRLIEDKDTILELTGKIQELQNEINCMNESRDCQDAESVRSGYSHVASQPVSFPLHPVPGGMPSPFYWITEPQKWAAKHLGHAWFFGIFLQIQQRHLQHLIRRSRTHGVLIYQNTHHNLWWVRTKTTVQDQRYQFGSSAKKSVIPSKGDFSKNYGADQERLQISDLHFDQFLNPATFACWKKGSRLKYVIAHNFLQKLCCGSKKWSWLIQWMTQILRVLFEEFEDQILKYSMRRSLQHWTESSIIPTSKEGSIWRNKKNQK